MDLKSTEVQILLATQFLPYQDVALSVCLTESDYFVGQIIVKGASGGCSLVEELI